MAGGAAARSLAAEAKIVNLTLPIIIELESDQQQHLSPEKRDAVVKLIGLTGNIASGKSSVARLLVDLGVEHLDADQLVHKMYESGTEATEAVVQHFGEGVLAPDGAVDRRALGAIVFGDPEAMRALEAIVHPRIGVLIADRIQEVAARPTPPRAMVVEAVKLIESGRYKLMDEVWFVVAQREVQKQRLMEYRGLNEAEAEARLDAQPSIRERLHFADVIVENSGSMPTLERQVYDAWQRITQSQEKRLSDA